jgi:hypothetical protein
MAKGCMQFVHLIESFEVISSLATLKRSDAEQRGQLAWKTFSPAAAAPPALLPVPAPPPAPFPVGGSPLGGGGGSTLNLAEHAGHAKAVGTVGTVIITLPDYVASIAHNFTVQLTPVLEDNEEDAAEHHVS